MDSMANVFNFTSYISLNNQPYITRPTLIHLNPDEYNQRFLYYLFMVNLYRLSASCNTLDDPSGRILLAKKTDDTNLNVLIR